MQSKRFDPAAYWDRRYREGRDSGEGSRGETGRYKGEFVNQVIVDHSVTSVIDWGCGDGQVLDHITPMIDYLGVDVSPTILRQIQKRHPGREFALASEAAGIQAHMALSMDVLFHFPADSDYLAYLDSVFTSAQRLVLLYTTDFPGGQTARHVRRREVTPDIALRFPGWKLIDRQFAAGATMAGFLLYEIIGE